MDTRGCPLTSIRGMHVRACTHIQMHNTYMSVHTQTRIYNEKYNHLIKGILCI